MSVETAVASQRRLELTADETQENALKLLLANYERVTADPRKMGYLRSLLKHYSHEAHPWKACYADNFKRFGPKTAGLCATLKDVIRQDTHWRGHPALDHGAPGVAIGEADKGAAPPWGGHHNGLKLDIPDDVMQVLLDVAENCDPCRVLYGLDQPPHPSATFLAEVA